jgi:hypothetical protein
MNRQGMNGLARKSTMLSNGLWLVFQGRFAAALSAAPRPRTFLALGQRHFLAALPLEAGAGGFLEVVGFRQQI